MPYVCSVPECSGYHSSGRKASHFRFPKDDFLRKRWLLAIRLENYEVKKSSRVCGLHFKDSDIEVEVSAYDSKTKRTITAPLKIKRLKRSAVPSLLIPPLSSASREDPEEKRIRKEAEQLNFALRQDFENVLKDTSEPKDLTESNCNSSSPLLRNLQTDDEVVENQQRKATCRKRKSEIETSKAANSTLESNSAESCHSITIQESPQIDNLSFNRNNLSNSTSLLQKEASETTSETFDAAFYKKPLRIDKKDEVFAKFVACEMSELRGNPELYLKSKQSILKLLVEAHFELMSS